MKFAALMPMKGNSERVPNKNLRAFNGKPLYHAVMGVLHESKAVGEIIVDTDSDEIRKDIEMNFPSVRVIERPKEICGDYVSMNKIIEYDMTQTDYSAFVQTHSTNPLLTAESLDKAADFFVSNKDKFDSVFSVTKIQTRFYWENGIPVNHNPMQLIRTQDLPPILEENSNFYFFTRASFGLTGKRIGVNPGMFEIAKLEAVDIDEPEDFEIAEMLHIRKYGCQSGN